jgi:hypothetical protein
MAHILVSYTSTDQDWAFWIGYQLHNLGHEPHLHDWEIPGGGDIAAWMEKTHDRADHILCVVSTAYLAAPYSSWERRAAQWAATTDRSGFALPVLVEDCKVPTLLAHIKRCNLYGISEAEARERLRKFLAPAGKPERPPAFPGAKSTLTRPSAFPGGPSPTSESSLNPEPQPKSQGKTDDDKRRPGNYYYKSGIAVEETDEGLRIFGRGVTISPAESTALLDRWYESISKFTELEKKRWGRKEKDIGPAANILAVLRACKDTYNRAPSEAEIKQLKSELARKFDLFFAFTQVVDRGSPTP